MRTKAALLFIVILTANVQLEAAGKKVSPSGKAALDSNKRLEQIFKDEWEWGLREFPTAATYVGDPRFDDRWPDYSASAMERRDQHQRELYARLQKFDRTKLSTANKLNYDLFLLDARQSVEGMKFPDELTPINQMGGVHQDVADTLGSMPRQTVRDYQNMIARLRGVDVYVEQVIALMKKGVAAGVTPPRITLRDVGGLINNHIVTDPLQSPLYKLAFTRMPASMAPADADRLQKEAASVIGSVVVPAYRKLHTYFVEEYEPHSRAGIALTELPDGKEWYAHRVKVMTTTDLTPDAIHEIGLSEVQRIRAGMELIKTSTGFKGTLGDFFTFLRTDPQFFFTEKEALLMTYRDIAKRIDPELPRLFGTLPRLPYGVIPVPEYSEKTQTTAYYYQGSPAAGRPGYYYANTYNLSSRPKWEMEALTVHEAVPGHHLQISLAQELTDVPDFRRFGGYTAFIEGWGLYSESLGPELGLYKDPYSKFGQLTYEMWRAVRLVVDTGMHAKGWSRDKAIEYFKANAPKSEHDITVEIDRYIVWPGQALAYKLGQLKISELRRFAESELGQRFDIRKFHDAVLLAGPLPLTLLDQRVRSWVAVEKKRS